MSKAAIIPYLEDAPLAPEVDGRGLSRVNSALLAGIADPALPVLLAQTHGWRPAALFDLRFRAAIRELGPVRRRLLKLAERLPGPLARLLRSHAMAPLAEAVGNRPGAWLFAPIGTDIATAERALELARAAGLRCALYVVDDLVAAARAQGLSDGDLRALERRTDRAVRRADRVFTITTALGQLYAERHQTPCVPLALPFEARPPEPARARSGEVVHIGAVNHIYTAGLRQLARGMAMANAAGCDLRLRLTSSPPPALHAELAGLVPVTVAGAQGPGALERLLAEALCAAVPVAAEPSGMYASSFPSKLLEYLNAAGTIVVVGPADAAASRHFAQHGLAYQATDPEAVATILRRLAARPEDHGEAYRAALAAGHHPAAIAAIIRRELVP